jgi:hypothetical protein
MREVSNTPSTSGSAALSTPMHKHERTAAFGGASRIRQRVQRIQFAAIRVLQFAGVGVAYDVDAVIALSHVR